MIREFDKAEIKNIDLLKKYLVKIKELEFMMANIPFEKRLFEPEYYNKLHYRRIKLMEKTMLAQKYLEVEID